MRRTKWVLVAVAAACLAQAGSESLAGKGGGGTATPGDIAFLLTGKDHRLCSIRDDGSGLTQFGLVAYSPAWSPDGARLAFWGNLAGPGIYVMNADGSQRAKVAVTHSYNCHVAWSPTDAEGVSRLAFTDYPPAADGTSALWGVYVMYPDGTGIEHVTPSASYPHTGLSWSPSGRQLACLTYATIRIVDLDRRDASGVPLSQAVYSSTTISPGNPEWAKTTNRIAFSAYDTGSSSTLTDLWAIDVMWSAADSRWAASAPVNLTNTPSDEESMPSWSPDDAAVVCQSKFLRRGRNVVTLTVISLASGTRRSLFEGAVNDPVWKRAGP